MEKDMERLIKLIRKDTPSAVEQAMVLSFAMGMDAKAANMAKKEKKEGAA